MRVLLDECVPRRVRGELPAHLVKTVSEMGWSGIKNGELLLKASSQFDCFLTVDRNLQFQQHLATLPIAVLVIRAFDNRFENLLPVMEAARVAMQTIQPRELKVIGA